MGFWCFGYVFFYQEGFGEFIMFGKNMWLSFFVFFSFIICFSFSWIESLCRKKSDSVSSFSGGVDKFFKG